MDIDFEDDVCDTGLVLGFGYTKATGTGRRDPIPKSESTASNPKPIEPSLTLGLSAAAKEWNQLTRRLSLSSNTALSSFSGAKRENDTASEEAERISSKVSDDEEEEGGGRKKLRLTKEQSALLENKFREHTTLNPKPKQALAKQLNLRPRQVEVWFQNRRARMKLKQTKVDCEVLKRCCETLSEENERLQKELQELKALKSASPMYTHLPAAKLTMCPSCKRVGGAGDGTSKDGPFGPASYRRRKLNS